MAYSDFNAVALATSAWGSPLLTASGTAALTGTGLAERLADTVLGNLLAGGGGDDTYTITSLDSRIVEAANGGIDTVLAYQSFALSANLENITLKRSGITGVGNSGANLLTTTVGGTTLIGGAGNDVLVDESVNGVTRFVFAKGSGRDVIYGFDAKSAAHDIISLADFGFTSFSQVAARMSQQGADVLLKMNADDQVLLKNVKLADLDASDFALQLDTSKLVQTFGDEFDGKLSLYDLTNGGGTWKTNGFSAMQTGVWSYFSRVSNDEKQIYVDPAYAGTGSKALGLDPFSVENGVLTITASKTPGAAQSLLADKSWTSGQITTERSFSQMYGYFEIKAQLPGDKGMWPAFWLLPAAGGQPPEIDIMEQIGTSEVFQTIHSNDKSASSASQATFLPGNDTGFHTYGLMWTAETLTWYVDGQEVAKTATPSDMHQPMYMIANLAVGGGWAGDPDAATQSSQYKIDYIKAYQLADVAGQVITGTSRGDLLTGTGGNDTITGGAGADTLDGMGGHDRLIGGAGNDTYIVYSSGDVVVEQANGGIDTVRSWATTTLADNVENLTLLGMGDLDATGNALDNVIIGNWGRNHLYGGAGNDTLDATGGRTWAAGAQGDWLYGGTGDDTYITNDASDVLVEYANEGIDTVKSTYNYTLGANFENLVLLGDAAQGTGNASANVMTGNDVDNAFWAGAGNDTLYGMGGNDYLDGGAGADLMVGGTGDDTYIVDNAGDVVVEYANEGIDTVRSWISYTLTANVENLVLLGNGALNGTGNALANQLTGTSGANILDGGAGADTMIGGAGNDTYVVDDAGDVVIENANEGIDLVLSSVSYALSANVENLTLTGSAAINATGNVLANVLTGNAAANVLDGGAGADTMIGGAGDDIYIVDNVGDVVIEKAGEGIDLVKASISYMLAANVENLTLTGAAAINGTGNALDNVIVGNAADNVLDGGAGNDTLTGGGGNDTFVYGFRGGNDVVTDFGAGDKILLTGFGASAPVASAVSGGVLLTASDGGTLLLKGIALANLSATATGYDYVVPAPVIVPPVVVPVLPTLPGLGLGAAPDTSLNIGVGGGASQVYVAKFAGDRATTLDTLSSAWTASLVGTSIHNLTFTGTASLTGTGNELDNVLTGNAGHDTLSGGAGNDTIDGGAGNDWLSGGAGDDLITGGIGNDWLYGGDGHDRLFGGDGNDVLDGNAGNDTLDGGAGDDWMYGADGNDVMIGGAGNDYLRGDAGADVLTGGLGADRFVYARTSDSTVAAAGRDVITDFSRAEGDKIDLTALRVNDAIRFVSDFSGHKGDIMVSGSAGNWIVSGDFNGDKVADFAIEVHSATSLIASDFFL